MHLIYGLIHEAFFEALFLIRFSTQRYKRPTTNSKIIIAMIHQTHPMNAALPAAALRIVPHTADIITIALITRDTIIFYTPLCFEKYLVTCTVSCQ